MSSSFVQYFDLIKSFFENKSFYLHVHVHVHVVTLLSFGLFL